jgi:hypothetical protein
LNINKERSFKDEALTSQLYGFIFGKWYNLPKSPANIVENATTPV